uniref:Uncharacterized protein n=1 Tax=Anopheles merus TaxID=30066 RepID=A0A182USV5_ANOME
MVNDGYANASIDRFVPEGNRKTVALEHVKSSFNANLEQPVATITTELKVEKSYRLSPDIIRSDRDGKSTQTAFPEEGCLNSITTSLPRERDSMGSSKALCVSTCGGIPCPGSYWFTVSWSGTCQRSCHRHGCVKNVNVTDVVAIDNHVGHVKTE